MTEEEKRKLDALYNYFLRPPLEGKPSRAEEIDDLLAAARAGKATARFILWGLGFFAAAGAAWAAAKGFFVK